MSVSANSKLWRELLFRLQEDVAIGDAFVVIAAIEVEVEDAVDALHIHREPFEPIGEFAGHRRAFESRNLLEIGELGDLHAVAPALPAEPPGAERRTFPVVLDEPDVMQRGIDSDRRKRLQIEILNVGGRGLQDHLVLIIVLQPVRVLAVAPVLGTARGLHIGGVPRVRAERAQRGRGMERARPDLHVVGLEDHAAIVGPITLQGEDQALKRALRAHMRRQRRGRHGE
jgi:hypothetical protein